MHPAAETICVPIK